jgi:DNA-binding NtrC family response regulator
LALKVLAILQDPETRDRVLELLSECGHETDVRPVPESAFRALSEQPPDLLVLEYRGEARALELIQRVKDDFPRCQMVIITDEAAKTQREIPPQLGVRNILYRPVNFDVLRRLVKFSDQVAHRSPTEKVEPAAEQPQERFSKLIGASPAFRSAVKVADQAAKNMHAPVLIMGEPGTGKNLVARTIHDHSGRRSGPFVYVACSSIPGELIEAELFGHEAGAFADAAGRKIGLIELANGGTLYLEGVGELELPLQAKLLRFMDTRRIRRVMSDVDIELDVRIVAASHRDLSREVATRCFRTDLYNRLGTVQITLPPLRERGGDIVELARRFADQAARRLGKGPMTLHGDSERLLLEYNWPGNVRELYETVERAAMSKSGGELRPEDFPIEAARRPLYVVDFSDDQLKVRLPDAGTDLDQVERRVIEAALDRCRGNVMEAARFLNVGRGALRYKIAKHKLETERDDARAMRKAG